jgi:hypothetical protein
MTAIVRKIPMAATVLAGFAIFSFDTAQAGPNGPSFGGGGISGISSMRMDFNPRIGGPGGALSRDDRRVVPRDVVKTAGKSKDTGKAAKEATKFDRVSNPRPATGGKGKEIASASRLRVPAPLAEIHRVTGGNLDDIAQLAELASRLKTGPLALGSPLFPGNKGDGSFVWPDGFGGKPGGGQADRNFLDGWLGASGAPPRFPNPSGKVADENISFIPFVDFRLDAGTDDDGNWYVRGSVRLDAPGLVDFGPGATFEIKPDKDGNPTAEGRTHGAGEPIPIEPVPVGDTASKGSGADDSEGKESGKPADKKDSQPVAEGTGRPGRTGWCSPTGGCVTGSVVQGPRIIPASDAATPEMRSQLPGWATDPCPDCTSRGGGGGYSGYDPRNEGDGDAGGDGRRGTPM